MTALTLVCSGIAVVSAFYFLIILLINIGIFQLKNSTNSPPHNLTTSPIHQFTTVTILIPARNEEENIGFCLHDLSAQDYPMHQVEIVVVNDHSTDRTEAEVMEFKRLHPAMSLRLIPVISIRNDRAFKKHSIRSGVDASSGVLIITTDADTRLNSGWISSMVSVYEQQQPKMIIGPVDFREENTFFERIQGMEFAGLMAATAGSCSMGFPLMCNGANLAFERQAYLETCNSEDDLMYPSGDDLFLMMKIRKRYGAKSINYLFAENAIVLTTAKKTFGGFFSQRIRWVSKSRGYTDFSVRTVSLLTWLFNFLLLSALVAGIFNVRLLFFSLILLGIKMILELPAVLRILVFYRKTRRGYLYPLTQVLNLVYVASVGILGNVLSYQWKGRRVNPFVRNTRE
ncbi:MAG: glycosyltransferase [Bacteroidetes bacterium]|nr:glycosyltransferase [Bacteroidota bacterium]